MEMETPHINGYTIYTWSTVPNGSGQCDWFYYRASRTGGEAISWAASLIRRLRVNNTLHGQIVFRVQVVAEFYTHNKPLRSHVIWQEDVLCAS